MPRTLNEVVFVDGVPAPSATSYTVSGCSQAGIYPGIGSCSAGLTVMSAPLPPGPHTVEARYLCSPNGVPGYVNNAHLRVIAYPQ